MPESPIGRVERLAHAVGARRQIVQHGIYMKIAGKPAVAMLEEIAPKAAAIIAIGSCASWGGIPSAGDNPTGATGVDTIIKGKPIVNLPGCPPNVYTFLGTVLQYARYGTLPAVPTRKSVWLNSDGPAGLAKPVRLGGPNNAR
jgi:NiFe hydrogenase small subunit HydA